MATNLYSSDVLEHGQIRLLTIAPGTSNSPIISTLRHIDLEDHEAYTALSYTWGSPLYQVPITINGLSFTVNANLYAALLQLRDETKGKDVWIDAICINQQNDREKSVHVPLMHLVYQYAEDVVVWLGRASEDSDEAMAQLTIVADCDTIEDFVEQLSKRAGHTKNTPLRTKWRMWKPLEKLFTRPWWSRIWVLQEVRFGRKITVRCGSAEERWEYFAVTGALIQEYYKSGGFTSEYKLGPAVIPDSVSSNILASVRAFQIISPRPMFSLEHALTRLALVRRATDPRDKVFGVLNMVKREDWPCEPDYNVDVRTLYIRVTRYLIEKRGKLTALAACVTGDWIESEDHLRDAYQRTCIAGLPSWVLDWTRMRLTSAYPGAIGNEGDEPEHESRMSEESHKVGDAATFRFENGDCLVVRCTKRVRILSTTDRLILTRPTDLSDPPKIRDFSSFIRAHVSDPKLGPIVPSITEIEYSLLTSNTLTIKNNSFTASEYTSWRQTGFPIPDAGFIMLAQCSVTNRVPIWTEDGKFGVAPWGVRNGDVIVMVEGCHVPLALRSIEDEREKKSGFYMVLGEVYLQGWNIDDLNEGSKSESTDFEEIWLK